MNFQQRTESFIREHDLQTDPASRLLDLISEVGEASKAVLKASNYGERPFEPTDNWREELGDILFSLAALADQTGVDLEIALDEALEKYSQRIAREKDAGSGR